MTNMPMDVGSPPTYTGHAHFSLDQYANGCQTAAGLGCFNIKWFWMISLVSGYKTYLAQTMATAWNCLSGLYGASTALALTSGELDLCLKSSAPGWNPLKGLSVNDNERVGTPAPINPQKTSEQTSTLTGTFSVYSLGPIEILRDPFK